MKWSPAETGCSPIPHLGRLFAAGAFDLRKGQRFLNPKKKFLIQLFQVCQQQVMDLPSGIGLYRLDDAEGAGPAVQAEGNAQQTALPFRFPAGQPHHGKQAGGKEGDLCFLHPNGERGTERPQLFLQRQIQRERFRLFFKKGKNIGIHKSFPHFPAVSIGLKAEERRTRRPPGLSPAILRQLSGTVLELFDVIDIHADALK